jgi:hypothetical protein
MLNPSELNAVKVGERVLVSGGAFGAKDRVFVVTALTKTQIVCGEDRFSRTTGKMIGEGAHVWRASYITMVKQDKVTSAMLQLNMDHRARIALQLAKEKHAVRLQAIRNQLQKAVQEGDQTKLKQVCDKIENEDQF